MNIKIPQGSAVQWIALFVALALVTYVPVARLYFFFNNASWGGVPQDANSLENPGEGVVLDSEGKTN